MSHTDERCTVITRNEDGEVHVEVMTHDELLSRLNANHYDRIEWQHQVKDGDPNQWPGDASGIILSGGPIVPKKIETVTRWVLP